MRSKLLKMTAFGPYGGEQVIDFTQLEDANMFLIYGPTGGGKTTILDAICYALYGETNGGERSGENMRSKFAKEGTITEVELFFELRGQDYRIVRRPQYERAPKKGKSDKLVKVAPEVELYKKEEDEYKIITSKYNEAAEKINELLHFNIGQFRQVIMIAQNKFRELLTVSSKERQQILQDIFETGVYQNVEKALDVLSGSAKEKLHDKEADYKAILNTIDPLGNEMLLTYMQTKVIYNAPEVCEILEISCKEKHNENEKLEAQLLEINNAITVAREKLGKLTQMSEDAAEKVKMQKELEILEAQSEQYTALRGRIERAEKAMGIERTEQIVQKLSSSVKDKQKQKEDYKNALEVTTANLEEKDKLLKREEKLVDEVDSLKKEYSILETYVPKVSTLNTAYKEKTRLEELLQKGETRYAQIEEALESIQKGFTAKEEALKEKTPLQKALTNDYIVQKEMETVLKLKAEKERKEKEAQTLFTSLEILYSQIEAQNKVYGEKEVAYKNAFAIWFNGQAAELAQNLKEDSPCPVCGALHHPQKAVLTKNHVTKEELESMEVAKKNAEEALNKLKQECSAKEQQCKLLKDLIAEDEKQLTGKEEITAEAKLKLDEALKLKEAKLEQLETLQQTLEEEQKLLKDYEERKTKGKKFIDDTKIEISENTAYIKSIESDVPEALRQKEALEEKLSTLKASYESKEKYYKDLIAEVEKLKQEQRESATRLQETEKHMAELIKQGAEQKQVLNVAIKEAGFVDMADYKASKMGAEEIKSAKESVENYGNKKIVLTNKCKELEEKTKDFKKEDLEKAQETYDEIFKQNTDLSVEKTKLTQYLQTHEKIIVGLKAIYEEATALLKRQRVLDKISSFAKGKNSKGLSFERYIQSSIFEEVLASANKKLKPMTLNRYELYRTDDLSRANAQVGLDIGIRDYYSNETRPVNTLSGGESFMAALALALGLSEVIQRLAGATPLDTLFIDEGFGSLDEEALEMAIKTLLSIQDTGRLIGIISHVRELREQIPVGLEVSTGPTGSKAVFRL